MKKTYIKPSVEVDGMETETIICSSQSITGNGITYGGVDEDGDKDPASRRYDAWNSEGLEEGF